MFVQSFIKKLTTEISRLARSTKQFCDIIDQVKKEDLS